MPLKPPERLQDMPPKWAHFCLGVEKFILRDLGLDLVGRKIIVAFSHGGDSTALLLLLNALGRKNGFEIAAAHLDHMLRPESGEEARSAKRFCLDMGIRIHCESADVSGFAKEKGLGLEEAGREVRYAFLERVSRKEKADYIALGHHLNDLAEDVLMRLGRGTGWPGLSGMSGYDPARRIVRPLLLVPKEQLIEFLRELSISWLEDLSNADAAYKRNRVREEVLPRFVEENPNFLDSVARLWRQGQADDLYWSERISGFPVLAEGDKYTLPRENLFDASKAFRLRLYKHVLDRLGNGQALADSLFRLDKAWLEMSVGSEIQFPGDKIVIITSKGLVFCKDH